MSLRDNAVGISRLMLYIYISLILYWQYLDSDNSMKSGEYHLASFARQKNVTSSHIMLTHPYFYGRMSHTKMSPDMIQY